MLDTVRRERLLMEQLNDYLLIRWCVGLHMDDSLWDPSAVSKNRERWLEGDVAQALFEQILAQVREGDLRSDAHFTVDGTLIEAWPGQQRCTRKESTRPSPSPDDPGTPSLDCCWERRTNALHASTTDPEARLYETVNLLNGIFQQPARYGLASMFGFGRDIDGHFAEWIGRTC